LAFPLDVRAAVMSSEIQFGYIDRPIAVNTNEDFGRFETCAHRWVHVAESDYGIALANDSSYGHDVRRVLREDDGGTTTVVRATVLREAEFPDPLAEEGQYSPRSVPRLTTGTRWIWARSSTSRCARCSVRRSSRRWRSSSAPTAGPAAPGSRPSSSPRTARATSWCACTSPRAGAPRPRSRCPAPAR